MDGLEENVPFFKPLSLLICFSEGASHFEKDDEEVDTNNTELDVYVMEPTLVSQQWVTNPLSEDQEIIATAVDDQLIDALHEVQYARVHWSPDKVESNTPQGQIHVSIDVWDNKSMEVDSQCSIDQTFDTEYHCHFVNCPFQRIEILIKCLKLLLEIFVFKFSVVYFQINV